MPMSDTTSDEPPLRILYASETGTAEDLSQALAEDLSVKGAHIFSHSTLNEYNLANLPLDAQSGHIFLFVVSTCGDGEAPRNMQAFWHFIRRSDLPSGVLSRLRFAVFGLGDTAYVKFNAGARRLFSRLIHLGARNVVPLGLGDDSAEGGFDSEWMKWTDQLCSAVLPAEHHMARATPSIRLPRVHVEFCDRSAEDTTELQHLWVTNQAITTDSDHSSIFDAMLATNTIITNPEIAGEDKEVRHIELDVSAASDSSDLKNYNPGDIVHLMPRNRPSAVEAFLQLTGFNGDERIIISPRQNTQRFGTVKLNLRTPCTVRELASAQLDLLCTPRRRFFEQLAPYASDERERAKLHELASAAGASLLTQYAFREQRTILMCLRDFPSARPPLATLIDLIPRLRSRAFSLASSPRAHAPRLHVCAAMVRFRTPLNFLRVGVCSSFFERLQVGDIVPVFLERGSSLRFDAYRPAVLVGAGTGVAPMRSFISSCDNNGIERVLFFGCRRAQGDFLYEADWLHWEESGALARMIPAFSREDPATKVYVQHRMKEQQELVWDLIGRKHGCVYVAGAAGSMPKGVRRALVDICQTCGDMPEANAEAFVRSLQANGRLQIECW